MDEQGIKKLLKLAFEAGYDYYADTYFDNEFRKSFDEWYDEQKLLQHGVMQAEGSDGVKEAAVASERMAKSVCADDDHDIMSGPHYDYCQKCYKKF